MDVTRLRRFLTRGGSTTVARAAPHHSGGDEATRARVLPARGAAPTEMRIGSSRGTNPAGGGDPAASVPGAGLILRGRYRLEALIGQGAMGQVWRARDLLAVEAGEQEALFAVKLFVSDFASDPNALRLMHSEATRVQKLAHPNIAATYVFDRDEPTGLLFMVMELVNGHPLEELLRQYGSGGLGRRIGVPMVRAITEGVAYAHSNGVVHCDLKPGNILVTTEGIPKILDFGIAQAVQRPGEVTQGPQTDDPLIFGYTRAYASPQALSDQPAHPADDVFSLGIVAYQIFAGRHPFGEESADVAQRLQSRPARPSILWRSEWRALKRALAFERDARWQDAAQFRKAFVVASRLLQLLLAAVLVLLLVSAGLGYRAYRQQPPDQPLQELAPALRDEVTKSLAAGSEALDFVHRTHEFNSLGDAATAFDHAYALHPRDPDAIAGLEEIARLAAAWAASQANKQAAVQELIKLEATTTESGFYGNYEPLHKTIEKESQRRRKSEETTR